MQDVVNLKTNPCTSDAGLWLKLVWQQWWRNPRFISANTRKGLESINSYIPGNIEFLCLQWCHFLAEEKLDLTLIFRGLSRNLCRFPLLCSLLCFYESMRWPGCLHVGCLQHDHKDKWNMVRAVKFQCPLIAQQVMNSIKQKQKKNWKVI